MKNGFSLIELMVVIAIIGILSTVGLVAYQLYIDNTKDEIAIDMGNFINRTLNQDVISIENDLRARSELAEELTLTSACHLMIHELVETVNGTSEEDGRSNPFNPNEGILCNGIEAAANDTDGSFILPRGKTLVYCDGVDENAHVVVLDLNFNVRTCTCYESDCTVSKIDSTVGAGGSTGYRCVVELTSAYTPTDDNISFTNAIDNSSAGCLVNHTDLYISGSSDKITVSNCNSTSCDTNYPEDLDNGTKIYAEEQGRCYYPFGAGFSFNTQSYAGGDYSRHTCANND